MRAAACALTLACSLATSGARADASSAQMVEKGIQLRREHRDAEALEEFRRADQLNPAPRIKAQIGLAEQALGQWVEAERDLNLALSAVEDPWIVRNTDALKKAVAAIQLHLGSLSVETNVAGAELWLNGARWGSLPMSSARVVAGTLHVEVRAPGYETAHSSIDVAPGVTAKERLALTPSTTPTAGTPPATTESQTPGTPPIALPPPPPTQRFFAWGALAGAGVSLGGAVAAQLVHESNARHYNDPSLCTPTTGDRDAVCGIYRGRAETAQTFATLGFIAGGTLGVASVILFLTAPSARPKEPVVSIDARPGGASVALRGTF
jgi:PEGA domain